MISEAQLTDLLTRAAETAAVPPDAGDRTVALAVRPGSATWSGSGSRSDAGSGGGVRGPDQLAVRRHRRGRLMLLGAAAAAVVVVGAAVVVPSHGGGSSGSSRVASVAGTVSGAGNAPDSGRYTAVAPARAAAAAGTAGTGSGAAGSTAAGSTGTGSTSTGSTGTGSTGTGLGVVGVSGARVVETASVALEVATGAVPAAMQKLDALVTGDGGYVASSTSTLAGADPSGSVTLRVPYAAYSRLHAALTGGTYGRVVSDEQSGQDVTAQYTDLGARLTALEGTRAAFLTLLTKANTIGDTLAVEQQISTVQQQIESLQGQQKVLADTSDNSTLTVTVAEKGSAVVVPPTPRSGFDRAWHDAGAGFSHAVQRIIADSGTAVVVLIVLGLIGLILWGGWRVGRRRLV